MSSFLQVIGTIASIMSIPLAIYFYMKANDRNYEKVRREIIKTLSYRIGEGTRVYADNIVSVYHSKIREYKIRDTVFNEKDILDDLKSDVISNAFLNGKTKDLILRQLGQIKFDTVDSVQLPKYKRILKLFITPFAIGFFILAAALVSIISLLPNIHKLCIETVYNFEIIGEKVPISYQICSFMTGNTLFITCIVILCVLAYVLFIVKKMKIR